MFSSFLRKKNSSTETQMANFYLLGSLGYVAAGCFLLIALQFVHHESVEGVIVKTPTDAIVIANHSAVFNCTKSNNKSIEPTWYHHPLGGRGSVRQDVYDNRIIRHRYKDRFAIYKNIATGSFNLLVQRPEPTDAGRYECVEDSLERDSGPSAELTVLDSNLFCESDNDLDEIVGPTECNKPIAPDLLELQCSVTYSGNRPPQMEWKKVGSELESYKTYCGERGNRVMCNTTLEASRNMDGSEYICQIKTTEQYNCSQKISKIIYAFSDTSVTAKTDEVFCSANTSKDLSCSYKWFKDNKIDELGQTLKPSTSGQYRCEAECKIRSETCALTAMVVDISDTATSTSSSGNSKLMWLFVVLIFPVLVGVGYCIWKKYRRTAPETIEAENLDLMPNGRNDMDSGDAVQNACLNAPHIGKGLSGGEMHGPIQYNGRQCTFERITFTTGTQTSEEDLPKDDKIYSNGRKWMALNHTNLIKLYDIVRRSPVFYVMMEYAAGGSVRKALQKYKKSEVNLSMVKDWATQIASGMKYLHGNDIVHRDLSSVQILVMESFEASDLLYKTLKISQFCLIDADPTSTHAEVKYSFSAPETFDGTYEKEGDVWSFGIVVWEILTKKRPYKDQKTINKIIADIREGATLLEIPDSCPEELKGILFECRSVDPSKRPSFSKILRRLQEWRLDSQKE